MRARGFYTEGTSFLHRLHPSTKLILYVIGFVVIFLLPWQARFVLAGAMLLLLWICGIPPTKYKSFLILGGVTAITVPFLHGAWAEATEPIKWQIWRIAIRQGGFEKGLNYSSLYMAVSMATSVWLTSTALWEMAESGTALGAPYMIGFVVANIFRYIPEVANKANEIMDVWRTRGVRFDQGPVWERFWRYCQLLGILFLLEFSRVNAKTNALSARGFSTQTRPTLYILPAIPYGEKVLIGASALVALLLGATKLFPFIGGIVR